MSKFPNYRFGLKKEISVIHKEVLQNNELPFDTFKSLSTLQQIELFRKLDISAKKLFELCKLENKGTFIDLNNNKFNFRK